MNPQSSRSSIALGPVPTAPKPAPNPITTNMPQFGAAAGVTNTDGVPTLPPVSPGVTQPLTPAPAPAPAPTPTSTMPQYMNASSTNMIPVVDKPLDINKVPDAPAEQFNPFASASGATPEPPKKSSGRTLNLLLGLLTALFVVAAVIFFMLWQQAANSSTIITMPTDPNQPETPVDPEDPDQPIAQARRLSCRGNSELTDEDLVAGVLSNASLYEVFYPNDDLNPTEVRIIATTEYNSPETAASVYAETSSTDFEYLANIFAVIGLEISSDSFVLDENYISTTVTIPADKLTNSDADFATRQILATLVGFPFELSEDGTIFTIHTNLDAVRANYEARGLACEVTE